MEVIDFYNARQQLARPCFIPRNLDSWRDPLPLSLSHDLRRRFVGIFKGAQGWIAIEPSGHVYTLEIKETGPQLYTYEAHPAPRADSGNPGPYAA